MCLLRFEADCSACGNAVSTVLSAFDGTGGIYASAIDYHDAGLSVIPCRVDKRPALSDWKEYQNRVATYAEIDSWFHPAMSKTTKALGLCAVLLVARLS